MYRYKPTTAAVPPAGWRCIELPAGRVADRPEYRAALFVNRPFSRFPFGIIETERRLTAAEMRDFNMLEA